MFGLCLYCCIICICKCSVVCFSSRILICTLYLWFCEVNCKNRRKPASPFFAGILVLYRIVQAPLYQVGLSYYPPVFSTLCHICENHLWDEDSQNCFIQNAFFQSPPFALHVSAFHRVFFIGLDFEYFEPPGGPYEKCIALYQQHLVSKRFLIRAYVLINLSFYLLISS